MRVLMAVGGTGRGRKNGTKPSQPSSHSKQLARQSIWTCFLASKVWGW